MRTKKVTRHYCDFCSKGSFKRPTMEKHEAGCTLNPDRICGVCRTFCNAQSTITELVAAADDGFAKLKEVSGGCPVCMLAAIRQMPKENRAFLDDAVSGFDFPSAMKAHWDGINADQHHGIY